MNLNYRHFMKPNDYGKRVISILLLISAAQLNVQAQLSGLKIAAAGEVVTDPRAGVTVKGIEKSIAVLRKTVKYDNEEKQKQIVAAKDPAQITKPIAVETITKEAKKSILVKELHPAVVTTSGTIYDIPGSTSLHQYSSLQANFKFLYDQRFLSAQQYNGFNVTQSIELYKMEKGTDVRSFCIPSGNCNSVNIPIQISGNGLRGGASNTGGVSSTWGIFTVAISTGYLLPGEYAFIDKSSLKPDGSALACFTFTVKQ